MAELLYRIGRFAARRHWAVVGAWLAVLAVTVVTYLSFAGALSSSISLPDTPTTRVSQQLEEDFEGTGGGNGAIVAETSDGSAFTSEQEDELADLFDRVAEVDGRRRRDRPVRHPAAGRRLGRAAGGRRPASSSNDGLAQLERGQAQIDAGRQALAEQRDQAREDGTLAAVRPQLQRRRAAARRRAGRAGPAAARRSTSRRPSSRWARPCRSCRPATAPCRRTAPPPWPTWPSTTRSTRSPSRRRPRSRTSSPTPASTGVDIYPSQEIAQTVPVDPRAGRDRRRGHRRDRPVRHARDRARRGPAARHRPARASGVASLASLSFSGMVEFVSVTPVLGVMLGLAVGIDYSLFIINRHRRQLKQGADAARVDRAGQRHLGQRGRVRRRHRHRRAARAQRHRRRLPRPDGHRRGPSPSSSRS